MLFATVLWSNSANDASANTTINSDADGKRHPGVSMGNRELQGFIF